MPSRVIRTIEQAQAIGVLFSGMSLPLTVEWVEGEDRSAQQNRLQWLWASEVARDRGDVTQDEVQAEWKLHYGVPILREDSAEFRDVYDRCIKPLPYEAKLDAIRLMGLPVTSIMKVRQMVRYLDTVEREMRQRGHDLTHPDPGLADYHARYRSEPAEVTA